jgi:hypothetical protein
VLLVWLWTAELYQQLGICQMSFVIVRHDALECDGIALTRMRKCICVDQETIWHHLNVPFHHVMCRCSATFWLSSMCGASAIALLPDLSVLLFRRYFRPGVATLLQVGPVRLCDCGSLSVRPLAAGLRKGVARSAGTSTNSILAQAASTSGRPCVPQPRWVRPCRSVAVHHVDLTPTCTASVLQEGELMEYVRSTGNKGRDKNIFGAHSEGSDTKDRKAGSPPKARGSPLIPRAGKRAASKTGVEMQVAAVRPAGAPVAEGHTGDWQGAMQHTRQQHHQHQLPQQQFAQQPERRASAGMLQQPRVSQQQTLPGVA